MESGSGTGGHDVVRLLLVEESADDARRVEMALRQDGLRTRVVRVFTESDLRRALEDNAFDIILADCEVAGLTGLQSLDVCQQIAPGVPFLFVSGTLGEEAAVAAMRAGAKDYFVKGSLARLPSAVRRELVVRQRLRQEAVRQADRWREYRRASAAVEASELGVLEHYIPLDGETYCSERLAGTLGYSPELLLRKISDLAWLRKQLHPDDVRQAVQAYEEFVTGAESQCKLEVRFRHAAGYWLRLTACFRAVFRDEDGCARHVVGTLMDLTGREIEARRERMHSVARLAGGIGHDFNNVLTAIVGCTSFALKDLDPQHPARDHLSVVLDASREAQGVLSNLLAFSCRRGLAPREVEVRVLRQESLPLLEASVRPAVRVSWEECPSQAHSRVDVEAFRQVLIALVRNACEALPQGGQVRVGVRRVQLPASRSDDLPVMHSEADLAPGPYLYFEVADEGRGVEPDAVSRVFEPFFTSKRGVQSAGLGLSVAYGTVNQLGGAIGIESELGHGTRVGFLLPETQPSAAERTSRVAVRAAPKGGTILVVDDNEIVRNTVARALQREEYHVLTAAGGHEALGVMDEAEKAVDLVLTDVVMPGMHGGELAECLLEREPTLPILYMSGYADEVHALGGRFPPTMDNTIYKPFTPRALCDRVRERLVQSAGTAKVHDLKLR